MVIYTVGHSTRSPDAFIAILEANAIRLVCDVRSVPRSRHNPQFEKDAITDLLAASGIGYLHVPDLGGLRKALKDSPNSGWKNASFRGYADYMGTDGFARSLEELMKAARGQRTAVMCAEAVPWRCHRSLIADALVVRGHQVEHIIGAGRTQPHRITEFARVDGMNITYPS